MYVGIYIYIHFSSSPNSQIIPPVYVNRYMHCSFSRVKLHPASVSLFSQVMMKVLSLETFSLYSVLYIFLKPDLTVALDFYCCSSCFCPVLYYIVIFYLFLGCNVECLGNACHYSPLFY